MGKQILKLRDEANRADEPDERRWPAVTWQKILLCAASAYRDSDHVSIWESWPDS
jgi:hypothetical protein